MAIITYPLNNIEYTAEDAELYHATRTSGVFANDDFPITVSGDGNVVTIGEGIGWIRNSKFSGKVVANKSEMPLDLGLPHATYPRIDAVVLQFNANSNASEIIVKNGTAKTNPTPPEVVRTESVYELHLYHVYREAGAASVTASNVTDLRSDSAYCGIMSDDVTMLGDDYVNKNMVGVANGVASLGGDGKVPETQLPHMNYIPTSQKAASNGVASLDGNKKLHVNQLPNMYSDIGNLSVTSKTSYMTVTENRSKWIRYGNVVLLAFYFTAICTNSAYWGLLSVSGYPKRSSQPSDLRIGGICDISFDGGRHDGVIRPNDYSYSNSSIQFELLSGDKPSSNVNIDVTGTIMYLQ